jgi:hypothetical protein
VDTPKGWFTSEPEGSQKTEMKVENLRTTISLNQQSRESEHTHNEGESPERRHQNNSAIEHTYKTLTTAKIENTY